AVLWSDLQSTLRPIAEADLGAETAAGRRFWESMVRLWTSTVTFEVAKTTEGTGSETTAARSSLISRVRTQAREDLTQTGSPTRREKWREVQKAFGAWWRPVYAEDDGEATIALAMHWTLTGQVRVELPGVSDQHSLNVLGERSGALDLAPKFAAVSSSGKFR